MSIVEIVQNNKFDWRREERASEAALTALKESAGFALPQAYLDFLRISNGGEGELPVDPLWFQIWPAEVAIEWSKDSPVAQIGYFSFGTNGAGENLVFDTTLQDSSAVFTMIVIGMHRDLAILVAPDFETFVSLLGKAEEGSEEND